MTELKPLGDRVLVLRDKAKEQTEDGIWLPNQSQDAPKMGVVQAVGPGRFDPLAGSVTPLTVKLGDRVIFSAYAGVEIGVDGVSKLIMSEDEVLAVI